MKYIMQIEQLTNINIIFMIYKMKHDKVKCEMIYNIDNNKPFYVEFENKETLIAAKMKYL